MGFRFFKRIKIAPGISFNLTKRGASVSIGPRGAKITAGSRGVSATTSVPGSGLYYTNKLTKQSKSSCSKSSSNSSASNKLNIGFFERLLTPSHKKAFIDGCKDLLKGEDVSALNDFQKDSHPDCNFMCGFIHMKLKNKEKALEYFEWAKADSSNLGELFDEYGIYPTFYLQITEHINTELTADIRTLYLLLVEFYQEDNQIDKTINLLETLVQNDPHDLIAQLSYSEILLELDDATHYKKVLDLIGSIENESEVHTCLIYYKAISLNKLELNSAATELLTKALRRKKNRSESLLKAIRYLRAEVYEETGKKAARKKDLELIYSIDPNYEDVAEKLGLL